MEESISRDNLIEKKQNQLIAIEIFFVFFVLHGYGYIYFLLRKYILTGKLGFIILIFLGVIVSIWITMICSKGITIYKKSKNKNSAKNIILLILSIILLILVIRAMLTLIIIGFLTFLAY